MNSPKDRIAAQLEKTRVVNETGKQTALSEQEKQAVLDTITTVHKEALENMVDPICIGPRSGELFFMEELFISDWGEPTKHIDHDYKSARERASSQGLRLAKPTEARGVERATQRDFSSGHLRTGSSVLDSEGEPYIFTTHPTWNYGPQHLCQFTAENESGSHIQFREVEWAAETRRVFSIPFVEKQEAEEPILSHKVKELLEDFDRMRPYRETMTFPYHVMNFSPSGTLHRGLPKNTVIRDTLLAHEERIKEKIGWRHGGVIGGVSMGKLELNHRTLEHYYRHHHPRDVPVEVTKLPLIFSGEWRLPRQ